VIALLVVLCLAGIVAYHHAQPAEMDGMGAGMLCLAVLGVGLTMLAAEWLKRRRRPAVPVRERRPHEPARIVKTPTPRARAGPIYLRLAVLRR
jgi:hypothetical protein